MRTHKMEIFIYYQNNELKFVYGYVFLYFILEWQIIYVHIL